MSVSGTAGAVQPPGNTTGTWVMGASCWGVDYGTKTNSGFGNWRGRQVGCAMTWSTVGDDDTSCRDAMVGLYQFQPGATQNSWDGDCDWSPGCFTAFSAI